MTRIKRGVTSHKRHKKILLNTKKYRGRRNNVYRISYEAYIKANYYNYRDRNNKKRFFRNLWIISINNFIKKYNLKYNRLIYMFKKFSIKINRKNIFNIIKNNKKIFLKIINKINYKNK